MWLWIIFHAVYRQTYNISHSWVGSKIVDHSVIVGADHIFILDLISGFKGLAKLKCTTRRETFKFSDVVRLYKRFVGTWQVRIEVVVVC